MIFLTVSTRKQYDSGEPFREARYRSKHTFSTHIKCAQCGRSFTRKSDTYVNTRVYWRCVTYDQYTAERCDNTVVLDERQLKEKRSGITEELKTLDVDLERISQSARIRSNTKQITRFLKLETITNMDMRRIVKAAPDFFHRSPCAPDGRGILRTWPAVQRPAGEGWCSKSNTVFRHADRAAGVPCGLSGGNSVPHVTVGFLKRLQKKFFRV